MTTTATENVFILDENFHLPNLGRNRRLWVYLPNGYNESDERYPVLYMHDGQNLFDEHNAFGNEWQLDESLDKQRGKIIVVGIDNGEAYRMQEYMLYDHEEHGIAEGAAYLKDVTEKIKPFIDNRLRTLPDRENTCIAGSSLGGLISLYAGIYFSHVFGSVGVFSPAFWINSPGIFEEAKMAIERHGLSQRWYFYAGARESESMINEVALMVKIFREVAHVDVTYQFDENGVHDEAVWKNYFPFFYEWYVGNLQNHEVENASHIKV